MSWVPAEGGKTYPDGNDTEYPVLSPSNDNKLYKESDVNAIALALGQTLTISEMAGAVPTTDILRTCYGSCNYIPIDFDVVERET